MSEDEPTFIIHEQDERGPAYFVLVVLALLALGGGMYYFIHQVGVAIDGNSEAIRRLDRIQHPTKTQFREDLKNGIKNCLADVECRRLFPTIVVKHGRIERRPAAPSRTHRASAAGSRPGATTNAMRSQRSDGQFPRSPASPPRAREPRPRPREPARGSSPAPAPSPSPPPSPPPGRPSPEVTVTAPLPVQTCVDSLVGLNCGR